MTTISGSGAHGSVAGTDRAPFSKEGTKGYHDVESLKDWIFGQIVDDDPLLAADSDTLVATQAAVKAYIDAAMADVVIADQSNTFSGALNTFENRIFFDPSTIAFDIGSVLGVGILFSKAAQITVPDGKQLCGIRWEQDGANSVVVGNGSKFKVLSFELDIDATSHAVSDAYGVIGALYSYSPGSAKAIYGRAVGIGSTGPLVALVAGITPGSGTSASMGLEIEGDSTDKAVNFAIRIGSNITPSDATFDYGMALTGDVIIQQAVLQANAHASHTGVFLRIRDTDNSTVLYQVGFNGVVSGGGFRPLTAGGAALGTTSLGFSALHMASTSTINWNNGDLILTHSSNTLSLQGGDLQLYSQASLHLNNVTRNYSWQAQTSPDRVRLLIGSLGDALYILANGTMEPQYDVNIPTGKRFKVAGNNVIGDRKTGWGVPTGTLTRTTFATFAGQTISASPTQAEVEAIDDHLKIVSERVAALINDLHSGGASTPTHALLTT